VGRRDAAGDSGFHDHTRFHGPDDGVQHGLPRKHIVDVAAAADQVLLERAVLAELAAVPDELGVWQFHRPSEEGPPAEPVPRAAGVHERAPEVAGE
jgi:hypothetical protein